MLDILCVPQCTIYHQCTGIDSDDHDDDHNHPHRRRCCPKRRRQRWSKESVPRGRCWTRGAKKELPRRGRSDVQAPSVRTQTNTLPPYAPREHIIPPLSPPLEWRVWVGIRACSLFHERELVYNRHTRTHISVRPCSVVLLPLYPGHCSPRGTAPQLESTPKRSYPSLSYLQSPASTKVESSSVSLVQQGLVLWKRDKQKLTYHSPPSPPNSHTPASFLPTSRR